MSWEDDAWQVESYQKLIIPYSETKNINSGENEVIGSQNTALVLPEGIMQNGVSQTWDLLLSD